MKKGRIKEIEKFLSKFPEEKRLFYIDCIRNYDIFEINHEWIEANIDDYNNIWEIRRRFTKKELETYRREGSYLKEGE